jgi:hypothetical protein
MIGKVSKLRNGSCPECCGENILVISFDSLDEIPFCICSECDLEAAPGVFESEYEKYSFMDVGVVV